MLSSLAPLRSKLSRIPLGRALIALGVVLVAINIASAIWDVRKSQERTERRAERYYSNMTRLLAEQTAASLEAVTRPTPHVPLSAGSVSTDIES